MKILLTGSAGFLGRKLYRYLKERDYDIMGMDIAESYTTDILGNFCSPAIMHLFSGREIDLIVHVGAIADVYYAAQNPKKTYDVNIIGTQNLVDLCHEKGIPIIYASTWEVYGEPKYQPMDENHPTSPDHPYNISKLSGELIVRNNLNPVSSCSLRLGTLYGTEMRKSAVIPKFINMAKNNEEITVFGNGEQFRQFTHVDDVCRAFEIAIKEEAMGIYNVVSKENICIQGILDELKLYFSDLNISYQEEREGDVVSSLVCSKKIEDELNWLPNKNFKEGFREMVNFYCEK